MPFLDFCCSSQKFVIYVTGSNENKEQFMEKVFAIKTKDLAFTEYSIHIEGALVFIQVLKNEEELESVHNMHMNMANGVIYLKDTDEKIKTNKKALFVLMTGKSKIESERNILVSSVVNGSYEECRSGVEELVKMIKQ